MGKIAVNFKSAYAYSHRTPIKVAAAFQTEIFVGYIIVYFRAAQQLPPLGSCTNCQTLVSVSFLNFLQSSQL